jgi:hypothetical protein
LLANDIATGDLVTLVYDGTNFQLAGRVRSWDFVDAPQALPGSSSKLTRPHGLGFAPTKLRVCLVNVTGNLGYTTGQLVDITSGNPGWQPSCDTTNVYVSQVNSTNPSLIPAAGGSASSISAGDWNIQIFASL